jgi:hypothetical protein
MRPARFVCPPAGAVAGAIEAIMETWYHTCGYPILVSSLAKQGREVTVFYTSDPQLPQRRISNCPGCDRTLHLSHLVPDLEHDDVEDESEAVDR